MQYHIAMKTPIILKKASSSEFMTVEEAADFLNVKPPTVRNGLALQVFTTYKFKTLTLLSIAEVKDYKKRTTRRK